MVSALAGRRQPRAWRPVAGEHPAAAGAALGLELASPRRADERGGSLMFRLPQGRDPRAVVDALRARGLYTDSRGPTLRLSPGNVTSMDGVQRLLRALHAALR